MDAARTGEFRRSFINPYGPWSRKGEPALFWFCLAFGVLVAIMGVGGIVALTGDLIERVLEIAL